MSSLTFAQDKGLPSSEGPFIGGVFSRPIGPPLILPDKPMEIEPPPLFDDEGHSNGLIFLLDLDDPAFDQVLDGKAARADQVTAEEAMLEAINAKEPATEALFAQPERARYLIQPGIRLDPEARALLSPEHPEERLHRYLVLRYPSVEAALAAEASLQKRPGVLSVGNDKQLDFSWAPNDPYFPINSASAGRYQWGMQAMNLPSAWDRTKDSGYIGAVDGGSAQRSAPGRSGGQLPPPVFVYGDYLR